MPIRLMAEDIQIPSGIEDVGAFRRRACSPEFPTRGHYSWLRGDLWVDLSMEQLVTHNRVKTVFTRVLDGLVSAARSGYFFSDRALLTHPEAGLSTEPDSLFVPYEAVQRSRVQLTPGAREGFVELVGGPEMTLEILSESSVEKDTVVLRDLYFQAGVEEYWLVDVRGDLRRFDILRRGRRGYTTTRRQEGWPRSRVFGRSFQLVPDVDPLGNPLFELQVRV